MIQPEMKICQVCHEPRSHRKTCPRCQKRLERARAPKTYKVALRMTGEFSDGIEIADFRTDREARAYISYLDAVVRENNLVEVVPEKGYLGLVSPFFALVIRRWRERKGAPILVVDPRTGEPITGPLPEKESQTPPICEACGGSGPLGPWPEDESQVDELISTLCIRCGRVREQ